MPIFDQVCVGIWSDPPHQQRSEITLTHVCVRPQSDRFFLHVPQFMEVGWEVNRRPVIPQLPSLLSGVILPSEVVRKCWS